MTTAHLVERVQTGVRIEKRILRVLKALAEYHEVTLGDLLEGIVLHAFEGKSALGPESQQCVAGLKQIYGLDLDASASHQLHEISDGATAEAKVVPPARLLRARKTGSSTG